MTEKLKLSKKDIRDIMHDSIERFEILFDDIPIYHEDNAPTKGETHRDYMEDDGREYRWFIFKDKETGIEHCINYIYHPEWDAEFFDFPDTICLVKTDQFAPVKEEKPEPAEVLTAEQVADKELWARYEAIETKPFEKGMVPKTKIKDICDFLKTEKFSLLQLRAQIIPICIEFGVEQKSFWKHIQDKSFGRRPRK